MHKHKIGDKVIIRKDLNCLKSYGNCDVVLFMEQYRGKVATIEHLYKNTNRNRYRIVIDNDISNQWAWTDEMFEEMEERE
jgi:hypothetical protein